MFANAAAADSTQCAPGPPSVDQLPVMAVLQMFVIKNLDTGLEMRIDDFDKLANIATEEVQVRITASSATWS